MGTTLQSDRDMHAEVKKRTRIVWMEQLDEDVRSIMRQESTTTRLGKDPKDDCSASYAVRDGDSASD